MEFVVFSDDWGGHPSSCQHLFRHVAGRNRVLWVNTVGMREPTLTTVDAKKALAKLKGMVVGHSAPAATRHGNLEVIQPPMLPLPRAEIARRLNDWSVATAVSRRIRSLGFADPTVVTTVPTLVDAIARIGPLRLVYYRVDDFSQWPGLAHDVILEQERSLLRRADIVLATSRALQEGALEVNSRARLFAHGVDVEHFANDSAAELGALAALPRPRAGYFGLIDERLDQRLLVQVASRRQDWAFVFAGPVVADISKLSALRNVHFVGNVSYRSLPGLVRGLDCLILPYINNDFTKTISPLKLKEYMLSGLPVVSSPLPEVVDAGDLVTVAESQSDWLRAIRSVSNDARAVRRRRAMDLLANQDWASRAHDFVQLVAATNPDATGSVRFAAC